MKIVATNQAATNVDATQILQDRAARLQGEGARPRKLQEANERLAVLNVAPTNAAVVGAVVDNDTREPRLDDAQVAKVCAVAKELRA